MPRPKAPAPSHWRIVIDDGTAITVPIPDAMSEALRTKETKRLLKRAYYARWAADTDCLAAAKRGEKFANKIQSIAAAAEYGNATPHIEYGKAALLAAMHAFRVAHPDAKLHEFRKSVASDAATRMSIKKYKLGVLAKMWSQSKDLPQA